MIGKAKVRDDIFSLGGSAGYRIEHHARSAAIFCTRSDFINPESYLLCTMIDQIYYDISKCNVKF